VLETALPRVDELYRFELNEPPLSEIFVMAVNGQTPDAEDIAEPASLSAR
jgi:hypothetical protein